MNTADFNTHTTTHIINVNFLGHRNVVNSLPGQSSKEKNEGVRYKRLSAVRMHSAADSEQSDVYLYVTAVRKLV
jgi:hypothetical protein